MDVNGLNSLSSSFPIHPNRPAAAPRPTSESKPVSPTDAVEISTAGRMLDNATRTSEFRTERLAQIKAAIDAGTYDTPEKFEAALSRMLDSLQE